MLPISINRIARGIFRIALLSVLTAGIIGCGSQAANRQDAKSETLPQERSLPDETLYQAQLQKCFPKAGTTGSTSPTVYACGEVRKPQMLAFHADMTLGSALAQCGGLGEKAFAITLLRRRDGACSVINVNLTAESYKPTGYAGIPLRKDDLIVVGTESY